MFLREPQSPKNNRKNNRKKSLREKVDVRGELAAKRGAGAERVSAGNHQHAVVPVGGPGVGVWQQDPGC